MNATSSIFSLSTSAEPFSRDPAWSQSLIVNSFAITYRLMFFIVPNSLYSAPETIAKKLRSFTETSSVAFGLGSLLDLFQAWLGATNPIPRVIDLVNAHRDGSRNSSCYRLAFELHWLPAFDREFPVIPESIQGVIHGLGFHCAHATATHRVVKHAVAIPPRPIALPVSDIVQHGSVPIFPFEWSAHDRPEVTRNGRAIDL